MKNNSLTLKKLTSSKLSLLATSIIASVLDVVLLIIMLVNGYEFKYIQFTLLLAIFSIIFTVIACLSNFRFKYTIPYIVLYVIVFILMIVCQLNIYFPNDKLEIATTLLSGFWLLSHILVVLSVIFTAISSRNSFKNISIVSTIIHVVILGTICCAQIALAVANGMFGHGANAKTIVYKLNDDGTLLVDDVMIDNNDTVIIPEEFNGTKISSVNCQLFTRNDINNFIFDTNGALVRLVNASTYSRFVRTDINITSDEASIDSIKKQFYNYRSIEEMLQLANSIVPNDLADDKVYINFTYDSDSLKIYQNPITTWIGNKGDVFSFSEHAPDCVYLRKFDHDSPADLVYAIEHTGGYFLSNSDIDGQEINESIDNFSLSLEKVYKITVAEDNDSIYEISDNYKYTYINGEKEDYLLATKKTILNSLSLFPEREGFDLSFEINGVTVSSDTINGILSSYHDEVVTVSPIWQIKQLENINVERSKANIVYGDEITLGVNYKDLGTDFNYEYAWINPNNETIDDNKSFTSHQLIPTTLASSYRLIIKVTNSNSSLTRNFVVSVPITVAKKTIDAIWVNNDYIYDGSSKSISVSLDEASLVDIDNTLETKADFTVSGDNVTGHSASQINAGTYRYSINLGEALKTKYTVSSTTISNSLVINKREITIVWGTNSFTYNGSKQCPQVSSLENVISADYIDVYDGLLYEKVNSINVGNYTASVDVSNSNYAISNKTFDYEIVQKPITAVWEANDAELGVVKRTYNGYSQGAELTSLDGLISSSDVSLSSVIYSGYTKNASSEIQTATASLPSGSNYIITAESNSCSYVIVKKAIELEWNDLDSDTGYVSLVYNGSNQRPKVKAVTGSVNDGYSIDNALIYSGEQKGASDTLYTCTAVLPDNSNYVINEDTNSCQFKILPKEISLVWEANALGANYVNLTYNGNAQIPSLSSIAGVVQADYDDLIASIIFTGHQKNASSTIHTATASLPINSNYVISEESKTCDYMISPKAVKAVWEEKEEGNDFHSYVYNGSEQGPKVVSLEGVLLEDYTGIVDTISYTDYKVNASNDPYTVTCSLPIDSNYVISEESNTCVYYITKANNEIVIDFAIDNWIFGQTPSTPTMPTAIFGMPTVKYYSDEDCTILVEEITIDTIAGKYYVVVETSSNENYNSVIKVYSFTIEEEVTI